MRGAWGQPEQGGVHKTPSCQLPALTCQVGLGSLLHLLSEHFLTTHLACAEHWEAWPATQTWPGPLETDVNQSASTVVLSASSTGQMGGRALGLEGRLS